MNNTGRNYDKSERRLTFESILYPMRIDIPLRDLPTDFEWVFTCGFIVCAHQHRTGAATADNECIDKSRGGYTTRIHLAADSSSLPIYFELSEGQENKCNYTARSKHFYRRQRLRK